MPGRPSFLRAYREVLPDVLRSPAAWFFVVLYLLAAVVYVRDGENIASLLFWGTRLLIYLFFMLLIIPLTAGAVVAPWREDHSSTSPGHVRKQVLIIALFLLFNVLTSLALFFPRAYPLLEAVLSSFFASWTRLVIWLFIIMVVLPVGIMLLLGVPWREMGFGRGYRSWRVLALMCCLPVVILLVSLASGGQTLASAASRVRETLPGLGPLIFHEMLGVSLPEEIFYRGILLTRLVRLLGIRWGSVLSMLIFALVHVSLTMSHMQLSGPGGLLFAIAVCLVVQGPVGLLLTVLFLRTRSLPVNIVVRTVLDVLPF